MDVIEVPAVPREAFNKHRCISDLIKAQVKHLKHLEAKLPAQERASVPQHAIVTENDAAIYIAAMTRVLCAGAGVVEAPAREKKVVPIRPAAERFDIAAAAEPGKGKKRAAKKAAGSKTRSRGQR